MTAWICAKCGTSVAGDARPGWFLGFPMTGIVGAQLRPRCGRIDLYAVPTGGA